MWLAPVFGALMLACPKDDEGKSAPVVDAGADADANAARAVDSGPIGSDTGVPADGCAYTVLKTPIAAGDVHGANALNELGQIGGVDGQGRPFIWSEGKAPYYFEDTGAVSGEIFDLDDDGRAVGVLNNVSKPDATGQSCGLFGCGMVWIPPGPNPGPNQWWPGFNVVHAYCQEGATSVSATVPRAIAKGYVVGQNGCGTPQNVSFYSGLGTLPQYLPAACGDGPFSDVNADFMVVGSCTLKDSGEIRGVRGKGDATTVLPALGGTISYAHRLNASGIAVGMSTRPDNSTAAVYWNEKDELVELPGIAVVKDGFVNDEAYDINDADLIVGTVSVRPNAESSWHLAAAWKNGALIDLNAAACTRAPGKDINVPTAGTEGYPQYLLEYAMAVNNKGQLAVLGEDRNEGKFVFLLTPR